MSAKTKEETQETPVKAVQESVEVLEKRYVRLKTEEYQYNALKNKAGEDAKKVLKDIMDLKGGTPLFGYSAEDGQRVLDQASHIDTKAIKEMTDERLKAEKENKTKAKTHKTKGK